MQLKLLQPADYRAVPWKNGQGLTREIAAQRSEEDARSGRFTWRLSIAEVATSAPFSSFPGVDRIILLLEGDGMMLDSGAAGRHKLNHRLQPYAFSGNWSTNCRLLGGPCRDFNVMVDRERARASVTVVTAAAEPCTVPVTGHTAAVYCVEGSVLVAGGELPSAGQEISAGSTLLIESPAALTFSYQLTLRCQNSQSAQAGTAAALVVGFSQRSAGQDSPALSG